MSKIDKAAIYCRLSKEDQDKINAGDESASIQNQKMLLVDYAIEHQFTIYEIYSDDDYSGMDSERPSFQKLIKDARNGCFQTIICKTQSRFTREMELVEKYIHGLFPIIGVRFIGVVDHVDTDIKGNKKARQINGLINEWYCEDLSENIRSVFRNKMEKGQFLGAYACYGYIKDPKDHHKLIVDEEAAQVVKKIFTYIVQGYSVYQICDKLYEDHIPTPSVYKKMQGLNYKHPLKEIYGDKYGIWGKSTVGKIIRNRMYIGDMVQGMDRKISYKSKKVVRVPEEEWIIVPGCHEPIIEKEVFEQVQKIIECRRYATAKRDKNRKEINLLAGKVRCKDCHGILTRVNGNTDLIYLNCQLYKRSKRELCTMHSIRYINLLNIIEEKIREVIQNYLEYSSIDDNLVIQSNIKKQIEKEVSKRTMVEEKIEQTKRATIMLYVDKTNSIVSEQEYIELKSALNLEVERLEEQHKLILADLDKMVTNKEKQSKKEDLIQRYTNFKELNHEIIHEFIDYIEVGEKDKDKNQEIIIHYRI